MTHESAVEAWSPTVRAEWTVRVANPREQPHSRHRRVRRHGRRRAGARSRRRDSREAFDAIVERHRRTVYQVCYRFVSNHEDASDLSQEAFVRAWRGLKNFQGQSALSTWLYRIAVNLCLNRLSLKTPITEPIELTSADRRPAQRGSAVAVAARGARRHRSQGDRHSAEETACDVDSARVSRTAASADRRDSRQLGGRGESQLLPCAGESQEAVGRTAMTHLTSDQLIDALDRRGRRHAHGHLETCASCRAQLAGLVARVARRPANSDILSRRHSSGIISRRGFAPLSMRRALPSREWSGWFRLPVLAPIAGLAILIAALAITLPRSARGPFRSRWPSRQSTDVRSQRRWLGARGRCGWRSRLGHRQRGRIDGGTGRRRSGGDGSEALKNSVR